MYMEQFDSALASLRKARGDEKYAKYASDLIKYVSKEKERQAELAKAAAAPS